MKIKQYAFKYKCFFIVLLTLGVLKILSKTVTPKRFFVEPYWGSSDSFKLNQLKETVNCTAIYDADPVEIGKTLEIRRKVIIDLEDDDVRDMAADCQRYIKLRQYSEKSVSDEEHQFPLAYSLVVHKHAGMLERLLHTIYMPQNVYCIHYDQKSSQSFKATVQNVVKCFPNVFIASRLESVQYAHISRLQADLNCLSDLLSSPVQWKYVINLCGQDFPLKPNFELMSELKKLNGANMLESSRPSSSKKQRFTYRYELRDAPYEYQKLPFKTKEIKDPPPHSIEMFCGSAYFVLSREFILHINGSQLVKDFLAWSADTYSPDEHFWATLVRVPGVPGEILRSDPDFTDLKSKTRLVKWSYLEGTHYPPCTGSHIRSVCIYGAAELHWLINFGHWFANKFDPQVDPVLLKCLEEKIEEKQVHWVNLTK